jgi:adenylate cyclase
VEGVENERRFLLEKLPPVEQRVSTTTIRQVYWQLGDGWTLRLRREGRGDEEARNSLTVKGKRSGVSRPEVNSDLAKEPKVVEVVEQLFKHGSANKVVKSRHSYVIDGQAWDVDEFHWENEGLVIAELELDDPDELARVPVPAWAVREITHEPRYGNESLAFHPYSTW